jgi:hypothetical protein
MKTNLIALAFAAETISRRVKLCTLFLAVTIIAKTAFKSSSNRLQTMNRKCLHDAARQLYLGR